MSTAQDVPCADSHPLTSDRPTADDEGVISDIDEPPDGKYQYFSRFLVPSNKKTLPGDIYTTTPPLQHAGKPSLLTQALLTIPDLAPYSDAETPLLISDGGLTSPARTTSPGPPSPPLPTCNLRELALTSSHSMSNEDTESDTKNSQPHPSTELADKPAEENVEAELGRRRCITFACGRQGASSNMDTKPADTNHQVVKPVDPPKRPCMLRFACPVKPAPMAFRQVEQVKRSTEPLKTTDSSSSSKPSISSSDQCPRRSLASTTKNGSTQSVTNRPEITRPGTPLSSSHSDLELSEATRFHEFAGSFNVDDEWMNEQITHRQKITVNDTLRKENAIRRIAEEVEEEALQNGEGEEDLIDGLGDIDEGDEDSGSDEEASEGGNETDDEDGFADSDDDSDHGSQYQFWTPGLTTAATSVDHVEHIRPMIDRVPSESSIESMINTHEATKKHEVGLMRVRKGNHFSKPPKMRPGTPDLPDSTDFVCGTLDEDRPLEAAYMSCLEERRRSRHKAIPQDIDPSFPTSDPEAEEDEVDDDDNAIQPSDEPLWIMGRPEHSNDENRPRMKRGVSGRTRKSPGTSPKYSRSPAPVRRSAVHRSPPLRNLFSQSPVPLRSPPFQPRLRSPPSTRRTSFCISPRQKSQGIVTPLLAQCPHLTHTTSLPRTPNPFWRQHREACDSDALTENVSSKNVDIHSRGPIEIVKGLECRRQRRREKLWRLHCRNPGKDKERRCQPGKGAERMRELGLEMANKARDYGLKAEVVLSA